MYRNKMFYNCIKYFVISYGLVRSNRLARFLHASSAAGDEAGSTSPLGEGAGGLGNPQV